MIQNRNDDRKFRICRELEHILSLGDGANYFGSVAHLRMVPITYLEICVHPEAGTRGLNAKLGGYQH